MSSHRLLVIILALVCLPGLAEGKGGPKGKGGGGFKGGGGGLKGGGGRSKGGGTLKERGGNFNGGGRPAREPHLGGNKSTRGPAGKETFDSTDRGKKSASTLESGQTQQRLTGRDHAFNTQRLNEERKLTHRQQTAQKLREIAERNGNENLLQTADRMDQKALDHYNSRLSMIDSKTGVDGLSDVNGVTDSVLDEGSLLTDSADELHDVSFEESPLADGLSDVVSRQLAQEERKLQHQLEVAQQLRDIAARNGNENLLTTAERMESMAADRYVRQLDKLGVSVPDATGSVPSP